MNNKFIEKVESRLSKRMPKGSKSMSVSVNNKTGKALVLISFVNKNNQLKTIRDTVCLTPETYPEALRLEGKDIRIQ